MTKVRVKAIDMMNPNGYRDGWGYEVTMLRESRLSGPTGTLQLKWPYMHRGIALREGRRWARRHNMEVVE